MNYCQPRPSGRGIFASQRERTPRRFPETRGPPDLWPDPYLVGGRQRRGSSSKRRGGGSPWPCSGHGCGCPQRHSGSINGFSLSTTGASGPRGIAVLAPTAELMFAGRVRQQETGVADPRRRRGRPGRGRPIRSPLRYHRSHGRTRSCHHRRQRRCVESWPSAQAQASENPRAELDHGHRVHSSSHSPPGPSSIRSTQPTLIELAARRRLVSPITSHIISDRYRVNTYGSGSSAR